ncbi:hypothetical protein Tco_0875789 [Tanacetum coccineum]|uniref:Uncharacterized protein n=1 Tax=Tanacetum coccineum TaxID=301880 RepID=A0ABQ5BTG4_9ASTR
MHRCQRSQSYSQRIASRRRGLSTSTLFSRSPPPGPEPCLEASCHERFQICYETVHGEGEEMKDVKGCERAGESPNTGKVDSLQGRLYIAGTAGGLHRPELQRRLVAVLRLDFVMASRFVFSLLCITG